MAHVNRYATYECDGWMICNLRQYGDTLVSKDLQIGLKDNRDRIQAIIEYALGEPVAIYESKSGLIAQVEH